jgi:hypothetical protein
MATSKAVGNRILERLPPADHKRIVGQMERITPKLGQVMAHPGVPPRWVHFPVSAVLSSMVVLENGLYLLSAALANPYKIDVQVEGEILRLPAEAFKQVLADSPAMTHLLMRYAFVSIERGSQNGACIQHHTIEERMCRWLLETAYRKGRDKFHLTQEFLADMLGVRRQSVNLTARLLQGAKLIEYNRGEVTILDRPGLEEASCECFRVTTEMYEQAMQLPPETDAASAGGSTTKRKP